MWFFKRKKRRGIIALIPISGVISMKMVDPYLEIIERAEKSKKVKGVLLNLSSQGGSVTATEVLYMALKRLAEKKPLYAWTTLAASGGYYAACAAEKILAPPSAMVGSIGVIYIKPVISGIMKKVGIKVEIGKEGKFKDDGLFFTESTPDGKKRMAAINSEVYKGFVKVVSEERGLDKKGTEAVATGEIFTARRGVELGLVDELTDLRGAKDKIAELTKVHSERVVTFRPRRSLLSSLVERGVSRWVGGVIRVAVEDFYRPEIYYM
ncbi:MAG: signal peptide peptidase SppA [Deltaproteobacteria bacterium]|uniref:Signal peptide peptidase SppA n=1 Tax=Candidatus Zymogenus saltonus TaxID=2844893 RepID=A0A9D8PNM3_9DELT|nr:signal peptide peptidase SppA [Candidatus Zymogenus saltonus]